MGGLSRSGEADERRRERAKDSPRGGEDRASRRPKQPERSLLHEGPRCPPKTPRECPKRTPEKRSKGRHLGVEKPLGAPPNLDVMYFYVALARSRFLPSQPPGRPKSLPRSPQDGSKEPPKGFQTGPRPSERNPTRPKRAGRRPKRAPRGSRQPKSAPRKPIMGPMRTSI